MKVTIEQNERFPVYSLVTGQGSDVDVPDDTAARWEKTLAEYERVQTEMAAAWNETQRG